jgi:hypothetical protein
MTPYHEELEAFMKAFYGCLKASKTTGEWAPGQSHLTHINDLVQRFVASRPHLVQNLAHAMNVKQLVMPCAEFDLPVEAILLLNRSRRASLNPAHNGSWFGKEGDMVTSLEEVSAPVKEKTSPASRRTPTSTAKRRLKGKSCACASPSCSACNVALSNGSGTPAPQHNATEQKPVTQQHSSGLSSQESTILTLYLQNPVFQAELTRLSWFLERMDTNKEVMAFLLWSLPEASLISLTCSKVLPYPLCRSCNVKFGTRSCGQCQVARYCSRECQVADWDHHQIQCSSILDALNTRFSLCTLPAAPFDSTAHIAPASTSSSPPSAQSRTEQQETQPLSSHDAASPSL